jgi:hypothetical protein
MFDRKPPPKRRFPTTVRLAIHLGMPMLELVAERPDWMGALSVALTRPAGVPERRAGEDPWSDTPPARPRPRRIADDLAWLRQAVDEPTMHGMNDLEGTAAVQAWELDTEATDRLLRLRDRQVLDAAGFMLHD